MSFEFWCIAAVTPNHFLNIRCKLFWNCGNIEKPQLYIILIWHCKLFAGAILIYLPPTNLLSSEEAQINIFKINIVKVIWFCCLTYGDVLLSSCHEALLKKSFCVQNNQVKDICLLNVYLKINESSNICIHGHNNNKGSEFIKSIVNFLISLLWQRQTNLKSKKPSCLYRRSTRERVACSCCYIKSL